MTEIRLNRPIHRPIGGNLYDDLATNPGVRSRLQADRCLPVDQFAATHAETIRSHYARICHFATQDAHDLAEAVWHHLHAPD